MKVKILVSVAGIGFSYSPGEVVDLPRDRAEEFLRIGFAEKIKPEPAKKKVK